MTLENLLKVQRLQALKPDRLDIQRLLEAAQRNLNDSRVEAVSDENRFDAAYKCIMQSAMAALRAEGYRPSTNQPGHHQTVIQALPLTVGLDNKTMVLLDSLRKQRNVSDYSGDPVSPEAVESCIRHAESLRSIVQAWLAAKHPDLS